MSQAKWVLDVQNDVPWRAGPSRIAAVPSWLAPRNVEPAPPPASPSARPNDPSIAPPAEASHIPDLVAPLPPLPAVDPTVSEAHEALVAENAELKAALAGAIAQLAAARRELVRELEPGVLRLALAVGEKLAGAALDADSTPAHAWIVDGLEALGEDRPTVIAIAPTFADALPTLASRAPGVKIEIDPALPRWGCVVRGERSRVDVGLSKRVAAVAEALGVESKVPPDGNGAP